MKNAKMGNFHFDIFAIGCFLNVNIVLFSPSFHLFIHPLLWNFGKVFEYISLYISDLVLSVLFSFL